MREAVDFFLQFSPLVRCLAIAIVVAASFMRQAHTLVKEILPAWLIALMVWSGFLCALIAIVPMVSRKRPLSTYLKIGFIFFIAMGLGLSMEVMEERVHILEYGFMGFLAAHDMRRFDPLDLARKSMVFCTLLGMSDELFQAMLPYRVGDPRDVLFNVISSALGVGLYLSVAERGQVLADIRISQE